MLGNNKLNDVWAANTANSNPGWGSYKHAKFGESHPFSWVGIAICDADLYFRVVFSEDFSEVDEKNITSTFFWSFS